MFVVEGAVPEHQAIGRHFAGQVFLRQRRPLVGQLRFVADQHQTAAKTFPPEGVDRLCAGLAAAYDEDGGDHCIPRELATASMASLYSGSGPGPEGRLNAAPPPGPLQPYMAVPVACNRNSIVVTAQR